jgi:hypothetical protein
MTPARERLAMGLLFAGLPVLLALLVIRPSLRRQESLRRRIQAANAESVTFQAFTPVGPEEQAFLATPGAPWRSRIPRVGNDAAHLAHVHRVVSQLLARLKARGLSGCSLRATWTPVKADCTLPPQLARGAGNGPDGVDAPECQLAGWVLEVGIPGSPEALFQALAELAGIHPLLEPVGLRWEVATTPDRSRAEVSQSLLLRNLYLKP